jgi:hypothetical protein
MSNESIASQLAKARKDHQQQRIIEVPEWTIDGVPLKIYVYPLTAGDLVKLERKHKDFMQRQTMESMIDLIILKAGDADGNRLFTLADKTHLSDEPLEVVSTVAAQMFGQIDSVEDAEKN